MESVNYKKKNKEKIIKAALSHGKERVEWKDKSEILAPDVIYVINDF